MVARAVDGLLEHCRPSTSASADALMEWLGPVSYALPKTDEGRQALLGVLADFDVVGEPENWLWYFEGATSSSAATDRPEPTLPVPVPALDAADDGPPQWAVDRTKPSDRGASVESKRPVHAGRFAMVPILAWLEWRPGARVLIRQSDPQSDK